MKKRSSLAQTLALGFVFSGIVMAADVDPAIYEMCRGLDLGAHPFPAECMLSTGDAYYECNQIGEYDFAKRTGPTDNTWPLVETGIFVQWATVEMINSRSFNWSAEPNPVGAVIVKSVGTGMRAGGYNVYSYDPAVGSDENLSGVTANKTNGQITTEHTFDINHITFCWNVAGVCMEDETAWAAGLEFNPDNGWAMYVPYDGEEKKVDLMAGQHMDAGDVTFSAPDNGWVTITISLEDGWVFYYDADDDEQDENIKVQDYSVEPDASASTAPGLFDWKAAADVSDASFTISVPENNFYAVHVDLATGEPCD